ncbi:protein SERAC1 [Marchantia polymorpha subsp. ruderalis]|uniref:NB-ARC domain-containing protein n=1 Tax=Marchantia polymorpha TaxID=3197 RepID=A0A2R6WRE3_MARPO|nr:hypothetical protein MARPO_0064s0093 [Marchantia polymorpha]PTQ36417.1 hypothetical protein MARPO_0064s0093 [Marchantia polymorpha]BBN18256.1 hypothetical protein Mp_8g01050 [Marchantia polymorpha subsp. ruderalis]BBN18257.1 hypothetical protein Mp_8g01050 [Marchantia polymorpha subsp. ruderalis]|eukprot:PTQ36416.1 hypothetical protein MARPO_0064s0093 [Marchantia polymorpha]
MESSRKLRFQRSLKENAVSLPPADSATAALRVNRLTDSIYELYNPGVESSLDIVFFHGLQLSHTSDACITTWRSRGSQKEVWPMTWLPKEFPKARILSVNYDAYIKTSAEHGRLDLYNTAESLMANLRIAKVGQHPVILVGHSYGGLVIKQLCYEAHMRQTLRGEDDEFLHYVRGVFFYGTPHHGSSFLSNPNRTHLRDPSPLLEMVKVLCAESARLHEWFDALRLMHKWRIASIGESRLTKIEGEFQSELIVCEASARYGDFTMEIGDHFSLCQPDSRSSNTYVRLISFIDRISTVPFIEDIKQMNTRHRERKQMNTRHREPRIHWIHREEMKTRFPEKEKEAFEKQKEALQFEVPKLALILHSQVFVKVQDILLTHPAVALLGMGGVGKTTLAKLLFNQLCGAFEYTCFLQLPKGDINEDYTKELEGKVCSSMHEHGLKVTTRRSGKEEVWNLNDLKQKRLLLVLDDIHNHLHVDLLKTISLKNNFADSRYIVTSRNSKYLNNCTVTSGDKEIDASVYMVDFLDHDRSRQLFMSHAFPSSTQLDPSVREWIDKIVSKCGGLPLTLEVMGSYLKTEDKVNIWRQCHDALDAAEAVHDWDERLWAKLQVSYNSLKPKEKEIFLDAATFFNNSTWNLREAKSCWRVIYGLEDLRWKTLVDLCLVYNVNENDSIQMHEQMRSLGMKLAMAWGDNHMCRTWIKKDVRSTSLNTAKEFEEVIALRLEDSMTLNLKSIGQMKKLRYLDSEKELMLDEVGGELSKTVVLLRLRGKVNSLHDLVVRGRECLAVLNLKAPLTCLPTLVNELQNLEFLKFEACLFENLPETFGQLPKLRHLIFSSCKKLHSLPKSFGRLSELRSLKLYDCKFRALPDSFGQLPLLETLIMYSLHNLQRLPEGFGNLSRLETLAIIDAHNISELPESFCHLPRLDTLIMCSLHNLQRLPEGFGNLSQLETLSIGHAHKISELPESFCRLPRLETLIMYSLHNLQRLPEGIRNLSQLKLQLIIDVPNMAEPPDSFCRPDGLRNLKFRNLLGIQELPGNFMQFSNLEILRSSERSEFNLLNVLKNVNFFSYLWTLSL